MKQSNINTVKNMLKSSFFFKIPYHTVRKQSTKSKCTEEVKLGIEIYSHFQKCRYHHYEIVIYSTPSLEQNNTISILETFFFLLPLNNHFSSSSNSQLLYQQDHQYTCKDNINIVNALKEVIVTFRCRRQKYVLNNKCLQK